MGWVEKVKELGSTHWQLQNSPRDVDGRVGIRSMMSRLLCVELGGRLGHQGDHPAECMVLQPLCYMSEADIE